MVDELILALADHLSPASTIAEPELKRLGMLIDLSGDLGRQDGIEAAIRVGETLLASTSASPPTRAVVHYFLANAWEIKRRSPPVSASPQAPLLEEPELQQQIIHLRQASLSSVGPGVPRHRRCQIFTNLGNLLSHCGRSIEAIAWYDRAITLAPRFAMAIGNRGYALEQLATRTPDPGHQLHLVRSAWQSVRAALAIRGSLRAHPEAVQGFTAIRDRIEARVPLRALNSPPPRWAPRRRLGSQEQAYREWVLGARLFLNDLNEIGSLPVAAADVTGLPDITTPFVDPPPPLGLYNQLKQEFVSARWLYYSGMNRAAVHFTDRDVTLVDTLDYASYSLAIEEVKVAFRMAYSLLDKIAFFLNNYLRLGIPDKRVYFRTLWYTNQEPARGIRGDLQGRYNPGIRGLFWLAKDLHESDPAFTQALEPRARQVATLRNHLEHKYVKVRDGASSRLRTPAGVPDPFHDPLAYEVPRQLLEEHTLWLLRLVREAIMYLSTAVYFEEHHRTRHSAGLVSAPVHLPLIPDEHKRN